MQNTVYIVDCYSYTEADECKLNNGSYYRMKCYNYTEAESLNLHALMKNDTERHAPAQDYFE